MLAHEAAALAVIDGVYAQPVAYTGAGLAGDLIDAIKSDGQGEAFLGAGNTLREISFEVEQDDLPEDPRKGNKIAEDSGAGAAWRVNEIRRRDDIGRFVLIVEKWT